MTNSDISYATLDTALVNLADSIEDMGARAARVTGISMCVIMTHINTSSREGASMYHITCASLDQI